MFRQGWNVRPEHLSEVVIDPSNMLSVLDNGILAYDMTQATAVIDHIGDRPCLNLTNSGSTATDIVNAQAIATSGGFQMLAGKEFLAKGSFRLTTTTQDLFIGLWAVDTNFWSTEPSDFIGLYKASAATQCVVKSRKASGTAVTTNGVGPVLAVDTWYDWALRVVGDPTTAGKAAVQLAIASSVSPGNPIDQAYVGTFHTMIPDTVDMGPGYSWRAGSAANVSGYLGLTGFCLQG
jgi:hypothetical protein